MAKLICVDVDGTLISEAQVVPESAKAALRWAHANGHYLMVCTGRSLPEIYPEFWDLGFQGIIAGAGSYVRVGQDVLQDLRIEHEDIEWATEVFRSHGAIWMWQGPDEFCPGPDFFLTFTGSADGRGTAWESYAEQIAPYLQLKIPTTTSKGIFIVPGGTREDVEKIAEELRAKFQVVHGSVDAEHGAVGEILMNGLTKEVGIRLAAEHLGVPMEQTVAIGDSFNDVEALRAAGTGIAMGNASDAVKSYADLVTDHIDNDGLAKALEMIGAI